MRMMKDGSPPVCGPTMDPVYEFHYGSGTLEDKCGIINAIAMQLYHLRAFSPKFYKDNPGFSESFKSLRNYNYAKRRAKKSMRSYKRKVVCINKLHVLIHTL